MVVPYSAYPTINQLIGMTLEAAMGVTAATALETVGLDGDAGVRSSPQQHFLHLLHEAERRHRDTLQRAIHAESQVQQLRQVFQQWQQQLQTQMQAQHQQQLQKLVEQELQQRQVQRQMQSLYDALLRQQRQQLQVHRKIDEMAAFQQLQAFDNQQHLGQMQLQMGNLDRGQRAERRSRQALQRQVSQSRRWPPRQTASASSCTLAVAKAVCNQDDCCPCEYPEECPFNPCMPDDCCDIEIPEGPNSDNCLLRDIRLGLVQPTSCVECEPQCRGPRETRRRIRFDSESESGYDGDDEASLFSAASSNNSDAFVQERRQILQEVRSLENTRLTPRYKEIYKPLRCFHCGRLDHLATFCPSLPSTIL